MTNTIIGGLFPDQESNTEVIWRNPSTTTLFHNRSYQLSCKPINSVPLPKFQIDIENRLSPSWHMDVSNTCSQCAQILLHVWDLSCSDFSLYTDNPLWPGNQKRKICIWVSKCSNQALQSTASMLTIGHPCTIVQLLAHFLIHYLNSRVIYRGQLP